MLVENKNNYVRIWLLLITLLVGVMIIVGGLTRLTDSGLSITKWDLVSGIFPPFNSSEWNEAFSLYKKIPEFQLINYSMTLAEFKIIYWWEYAHRLLGRLIGLLYIIPLIFFTISKLIKKENIISLYLIFILICIQGFLGWYMVMSGLTGRTDVSHYRLSLHLTLAFCIFILLLWNYYKYKNFVIISQNKKLPLNLPVVLVIIVLIQISIGALVSGLDAGLIYRTWPLMNQSYFPDDSLLKDLLSIKSIETPSLVQFIHRNIAYFIFLTASFILYITIKNKNYSHFKNLVLIIFFILIIQMILGILTVLSGAQIYIASLHQLGSIFLISASIKLAFINSKSS